MKLRLGTTDDRGTDTERCRGDGTMGVEENLPTGKQAANSAVGGYV